MENGKIKVDLHTHTNKSDGDLAPSDLVKYASENNIDVLSITDHDSIAGLAEGEEEAKIQGIKFIPGLEISTKGGRELHILGYNVDRTDRDLIAACDEFMRLRLERESRILEFLASKGVFISEEDVREEALGEYVGRPHIAQAMIKKGYVDDMREAFLKYLATDEFQKIERPKPDTGDGIEVIRSAGGVAALAHPHSLHLDDGKLDTAVGKLKEQGLEAMECYYSAYSSEESEKYKAIADRHGLLITGGSDYHGARSKPHVKIGISSDYSENIDYKILLNSSL